MKTVFRISNRLRSGAPIPRDFMPIKGLEHLGLVYQSRTIDTPEEFNEVSARLRDQRFPNRGCQFFPHALTAEDEAKMNAEPVAAPPAPVAAAEPAAVNPTETPEAPAAEFVLDGKSIYYQGERVAGLYGKERSLRVFNEELRERIVAWLAEQPTE